MHIRTTVLMTLVILLCGSVAFAAPTKLSQQGRLLDGDSQPLIGTHGLVFKLFDAETGGAEVWQEERVVSFEEGYYSIVLGEQVPLSDLLFAAGSVWLELTVDGAVLSPRHEVVSVPYALRAAVASAVEGGPVDADEISVAGSPVIDSNGNWVGTAVDWSELTGVPADLTDGDADTDTLLGLPCADGFVAKYSAALGAWDCAQDNDTLGGLSCQAGEIPVYEATAGLWVCGVDVDTDTNTQLTEVEVDAFVANNDYSTGAHTVDTNTQLTDAQVAAAVLAEGFVTGAHTVDTNTQLTNAQVAAVVLAEGFVTGPHTIDTNTQLTESQVDVMVANNGYVAGGQLQVCEVNTSVCLGNYLSEQLGPDILTLEYRYRDSTLGPTATVQSVRVFDLPGGGGSQYEAIPFGPSGTTYYQPTNCGTNGEVWVRPGTTVPYNPTAMFGIVQSHTIGSYEYARSFRTAAGCTNVGGHGLGSTGYQKVFWSPGVSGPPWNNQSGTGLQAYELRIE